MKKEKDYLGLTAKKQILLFFAGAKGRLNHSIFFSFSFFLQITRVIADNDRVKSLLNSLCILRT